MDSLRNSVSQGPWRVIFMIVAFILIVLALYYLYNWLYGNSEMQDYVVYGSSNTGLVANITPTALKGEYSTGKVPPMYTGGEFSISTWIYVDRWTIDTNKPFLVLKGGNNYNTMVMYLGQRVNKLGIRLTTSTNNDGIKTPIESSSEQLTSITSSNPGTPYSDQEFKKCDIESINLQRWVNITTVVSGKTVDVYIDGKLSRSVIMPSPVQFDPTGNTTLSLGHGKGFIGYIGRTRAANFAYSPDLVYRYYQYGPFTGAFSLLNLNFSKWTFDIKQDGVSIFGST